MRQRHPAFAFRGSLLAWACVVGLACTGSTGEPGTGTGGANGGAGPGSAGDGAGGTVGSAGNGGSAGQSGSGGSVGPGTAGTTGGTAGPGTAGTGGSAGSGTAGAGTAGAGAAGTSGGRGGAAGTTTGTAGAGGRGGGAGTAAGGRGGAAGTTAGAGGRGGGAGTGTGGTSAAGTTGTGGCSPPAQGTLVGWASLNGGTTGGGSATPQTVTTLQQFTSAVGGTNAAVIIVNGVFANARISIGSNKTIIGVCGAELHGHLSIQGTNVILRNIKIVGYGVGNCALDPNYDSSVGCSSGDDAITIQGAQHIWVDHCDISDGTDGNLDINTGADYITVSWTKFHYTPRTDPTGNDNTGAEGHRFSNLIGSADNVPQDMGHLNITWDHDWWADNVNQRMPRSRAGKIHVLNSLYTASGDSYCTNAGNNAQLLVEGTAYIGVKAPFQVTMNGILNAPSGSNLFMNTSGTTTSTGSVFTPMYQYTVEPASGISATVMAGAGPH